MIEYKKDKSWKSDIIISKYIPFKEKSGIITQTIRIGDGEIGSYPMKHKDNICNLYPPNLFQQALHML